MPQEVITALQLEIKLKHEAFERELTELRRQIADQAISTQQAHDRIDQLEKTLKDLKTEMEKIGQTVTQFSPKLDEFTSNMWKLIFLMLAVIAGLVGIKIW